MPNTHASCDAASHPVLYVEGTKPAEEDRSTVYADVATTDAHAVVMSARDRCGLVMLYLTASEALDLAEQLLCSVRAAAVRDALAAVAPPF